MQELAAIHPALELKVSKKAQRLALRLDPKERIMRLVVPNRVSRKAALAFAQSHRSWIAEKLQALPRRICFTDGEILPLFGRNYTLTIQHVPGRTITDICFSGDQLIVKTGRPEINARLTRFLKEQVKERISALAEEKAAIIDKKIKTIQVRDTKTRWGSCSADGRLSFSWRLIFAPVTTLDYIVAHEVAHLRHLDHSRNFWRLCEELSSDYQAGKSWIRSRGNELMRYG